MSARYQAIDFTATNPRRSRLAVDPTDLPGGDLYYVVAADSYREQFTAGNGSVASADLIVPWSDADNFVDFTIGYVNGVPTDSTRFHRVPPMASPYESSLYAESCELAEYGFWAGGQRSNASQNHYPDADWARYRVEWRSRLYDVLSDTQVDSSDYPWAAYECKELGRYVTRVVRSVSEELRIGQYKLQAFDGADWKEIPENGFVPNNYLQVTYLWRDVPYRYVPLTAIADCAGKVNDAAFDKTRNLADNAWIPRWATGTMLFQGLGEELHPRPGPRGELLVDVVYNFKWQKGGSSSLGHNAYPDPNPALPWRPLRRVGSGAPLYGSADFRALFKPSTV